MLGESVVKARHLLPSGTQLMAHNEPTAGAAAAATTAATATTTRGGAGDAGATSDGDADAPAPGSTPADAISELSEVTSRLKQILTTEWGGAALVHMEVLPAAVRRKK